MADPCLPNALYIGLARAGSTWLSEVLRHHPDVYVPPIKDLYFFDRDYARGLEWYRGFFAEGAEQDVRIEFSHDYFHVPYVPHRVAHDLDAPHVLVTLREPVSWVVSTYRNMRRNGAGGESFGWAVSQHVGMVAAGLYSRYLQLWLEALGPDRVHVLLFDDLRAEPQAYLDEVLEALGLAAMAVPTLDDEAINAAAEPRWAPAARAVRSSAQVVRRLGQPEAVGRLKRSKLLRTTLYRPPRSPEPVSEEITDALTRFFRQDVHTLSELTGLDLVARWGY